MLSIMNSVLTNSVFVHETGFNLHIYCHYGYPFPKCKTNKIIPFNIRRNCCILYASFSWGIIGHQTISGTFNATTFASFIIKELLKHESNKLLIIINNVKFHLSRFDLSVVMIHVSSVRFLFPCNSILNLIVKAFSSLEVKSFAAPEDSCNSDFVRVFHEYRWFLFSDDRILRMILTKAPILKHVYISVWTTLGQQSTYK